MAVLEVGMTETKSTLANTFRTCVFVAEIILLYLIAFKSLEITVLPNKRSISMLVTYKKEKLGL
jgi:hypothetical protein